MPSVAVTFIDQAGTLALGCGLTTLSIVPRADTAIVPAITKAGPGATSIGARLRRMRKAGALGFICDDSCAHSEIDAKRDDSQYDCHNGKRL
jgi:hypothetical protein